MEVVVEQEGPQLGVRTLLFAILRFFFKLRENSLRLFGLSFSLMVESTLKCWGKGALVRLAEGGLA